MIWWPGCLRQVNIRGTIIKTSRKESDTYFHSRLRGSQIGAHASVQSKVIKGRAVLEQKTKDFTKKFQGYPG